MPPTPQPAAPHPLATRLLDRLAPAMPGGYFLVSVDWVKEGGRQILRLDVDKTGHRITIDECEMVSRHLEAILDETPDLAGLAYALEVGSPGVFRTLSTPRELAYYIGSPVQLCEPDTHATLAEGVLEGFDPTTRSVTVAGKTHVLSDKTTLSLNPPFEMPDAADAGDDETCALEYQPDDE
ncbi:MAG: ribosome maturation factor RimP [Candidatus Melainabacteria bacterium]